MGKIELDHTGSGSGVTLSSDGTDLLLDGTAIGGGGGGSAFDTPEVKTANWSVSNSDKGKVFIIDTNGLTLTLPQYSTLDSDWFIRVYTKGNSFQPSYGSPGSLTVDPQYSTYSGRVNSTTSWTMKARQGGILFKDPEQSNNFVFDTHSTNWDFDINSTANAGQASATGWGSVAISGQATASGTGAISIGYLSNATGNDSVAIGGNSAQAVATDAIALGNSRAGGSGGIAIGIDNNTSTYGATGANGIAIGKLAKATGSGSVAISAHWYTPATSSANGAIAIGENVTASGQLSTVIGANSTASHQSSTAIGVGVQTTASNQVSIGSTDQTVRISERYTLPTADGTNGQVMTTDGSGAVTFADAGGGGADLYAANESSPTAQPSATGANAIAIGDSSVASGTNSFAFGPAQATGTRSMAFNTGANAAYGSLFGDAIAMGEFSKASNSMSIAIGRSAVSTGSQALSLGPYSQALGSNSTALAKSYASGSNSFAAAMNTNSSSYGAQGFGSVVIGQNSKATATRSFAIGATCSSTSENSITIGHNNTTSGFGAFAFGSRATSAVRGKYAFAAGRFAADGDAQGGQFILRADTTDATATVLTTNNNTAAADNQIVAASDTCIMFSGTLVAMQNGAQDQGGWEIKGLLKNDGGTTTLVSSNIQTFADGNGWTVVLTADNTNNALAITCTGEAAHNIRWVANISTSEVTYA